MQQEGDEDNPTCCREAIRILSICAMAHPTVEAMLSLRMRYHQQSLLGGCENRAWAQVSADERW